MLRLVRRPRRLRVVGVVVREVQQDVPKKTERKSPKKIGWSLEGGWILMIPHSPATLFADAGFYQANAEGHSKKVVDFVWSVVAVSKWIHN